MKKTKSRHGQFVLVLRKFLPSVICFYFVTFLPCDEWRRRTKLPSRPLVTVHSVWGRDVEMLSAGWMCHDGHLLLCISHLTLDWLHSLQVLWFTGQIVISNNILLVRMTLALKKERLTWFNVSMECSVLSWLRLVCGVCWCRHWDAQLSVDIDPDPVVTSSAVQCQCRLQSVYGHCRKLEITIRH